LPLDGDIGWLMRQHDLACEKLLSVAMVLADGRFVTVSTDGRAGADCAP